jgi:hypothetical protein
VLSSAVAAGAQELRSGGEGLRPEMKNPKASARRSIVLKVKEAARASSICSDETPATSTARMPG